MSLSLPEERIFEECDEGKILLTVDLDLDLRDLVVSPNLEEFWNVEDDREENDEAFVELDVLLRQDGGVAKLAVETDPDVQLKTESTLHNCK